MSKSFSDLVTYFASVPRFEGFDHALRFNKAWNMTSFGETRALSIANDTCLAISHAHYNVRFNR